jgi:hypothetical protein
MTKRRKLTSLAVSVLVPLLLAACVGAPAETAEEPPAEAAGPPQAVEISVAVATEEVLGEYGEYEEFVEFPEDGSQRIIFTTNVAARDFKFIEIGIDGEGEILEYSPKRELYALEELTPEKPFVVTWTPWGLVSHRGISFLDETDKERYFYITTSGEDGSVMLLEF